jgi:type IV pilus assembly protein PilW
MTRSLRRGGRGDSLIEVLVAMSLTAITALGIIGSQLWLARTERSLAARESATSIADSVAEGSGKPGTGQPLVEGIERLRFGYWLKDALSSVDAAAISRVRWPLVVAVDVRVLVRGDSASATAHPRYIDRDGVSVVSADGRIRQVFRRRIALRNAMNSPNSPGAASS